VALESAAVGRLAQGCGKANARTARTTAIATPRIVATRVYVSIAMHNGTPGQLKALLGRGGPRRRMMQSRLSTLTRSWWSR
jgi:hypothetical protein